MSLAADSSELQSVSGQAGEAVIQPVGIHLDRQKEIAAANEGQLSHVPVSEEPLEASLLDVCQVAQMLTCSERTVYRMVDSGQFRCAGQNTFASSVVHEAIEQWISDGCPRMRR